MITFEPTSAPRDPEMLAVATNACVNLGGRSRSDVTAGVPRRGGDAVAAVLLVTLAATVIAVGWWRVAAVDAGPAHPRCQAIQWVFDPGDAPPGGLADVQVAMRRLTSLSGIPFRFVGEAPGALHGGATFADDGAPQPVRVGWARSVPASLYGQTDVTWVGGPERAVVEGGTVILNATVALPSGFADRRSWGGVLLHELGHLLRVPHSTDAGDVMFPLVEPGPLRWDTADLDILRSAGTRAGCSA
jgi:hypothetical protein